jgi:NADH-quinone oxidoreductase subunit B
MASPPLAMAENARVPAVDPAELRRAFRLRTEAGEELNVSVVSLGLACCAVEVVAAAARPSAAGAAQLQSAGAAREPSEVLVVAGTVTDKLAPAVLGLYRQLEPEFVISFGACSNTGGPYWDSYSVTKGVDQLIPVDVYVPGCPPHPEALLSALSGLRPRRAVR